MFLAASKSQNQLGSVFAKCESTCQHVRTPDHCSPRLPRSLLRWQQDYGRSGRVGYHSRRPMIRMQFLSLKNRLPLGILGCCMECSVLRLRCAELGNSDLLDTREYCIPPRLNCRHRAIRQSPVVLQHFEPVDTRVICNRHCDR